MPLIRWGIRMAYDDAQKIKALQEIQDMSKTPKKYDDLQYLAMMKQRKSPIPVFVPEQPVVNRARGGGDLPSSQPIMPIMGQQVQTAPDKKTKVGQILNKPISDKEGKPTDLVTEITEAYIDMMPPSEKGKPSLEKMLPKENVVVANMLNQTRNPVLAQASGGGLMAMASDKFEGRVPGDGHGMQDNVYMPIKDKGEEVATLAVSPKEYVVDAHTMSAIGNGNADKGADVMDNIVKNIRQKAYGTDQQPNEINGLAALRPMIERV